MSPIRRPAIVECTMLKTVLFGRQAKVQQWTKCNGIKLWVRDINTDYDLLFLAVDLNKLTKLE